MIRSFIITLALFSVSIFAGSESNLLPDQESFIRDATPEDIPAIYGLVVELADYEKKEYRRRGVATQLMAHLAKEALATGCVFMEWNVFAWNEPAIALFEKKFEGELRRDLIPVKLK